MNQNVDDQQASMKLLISPVLSIPTTTRNRCVRVCPSSTSNNKFNHNKPWSPFDGIHSHLNDRESNEYPDGITMHSTAHPTSPFVNGRISDNSILYQIISNEVNHPENNKFSQEIDSRNTVVKKAADGAVQITYKNMINTAPVKKDIPVYILPKPQQCASKQNNAPETNENSVNGFHCTQGKIFSNSVVHKNEKKKQSRLGTTNNLSICLPKINSKKSPLYNNNMYLDNLTNGHQSNTLPINTTTTDGNMTYSVSNLTTTDCTLTSHPQPTMPSNPFRDIDIDLLCLNTDAFDPSHEFFLPTDSTLSDPETTMDEVVTLLSSSTAETRSCHFSQCVQSPTGSDVQKQQLICSTSAQLSLSDASYMDSYAATQYNGQTMKVDLISDTHCHTKQPANELLRIIDVSPECAPSSGGSKIILIGSWNAKDARYRCKFGVYVVDAVLIQIGVLRCYSPVHNPGTVKLSVFCNDAVISNETNFTFVNQNKENNNEKMHEQWLSITDKSLTHLLVERISFISEMIGQTDCAVTSSHILNAGEDGIENRLLEVCKELMITPINIQFDYNIENTMTILHLAAALGYIKLIQLLMNWVETNPTTLIIAEANPRCVDQFHLLPIMWSSAKGHFNTTCVLHQWAEDTLERKDQCGCNAMTLATECGHGSLVEYLGRLLKKSAIARDEQPMITNQTPCSLSSTPCSLSSTGQQRTRYNAEDSSPKTLGKALAYIQSMLNGHDDERISQEMSDDRDGGGDVDEEEDGDDASLFDAAQFPSGSMLSPNSPSQTSLQSPFNRQIRETAEFCEFFYKAKMIEKDFAELTLTDQEQEELYRAANVIQTAYKAYKERRKQRDQEFSSATLIQSYYRRYKQYASFKKMQKGAVLIQNHYRAHREKAKKKWEAAFLIQSYYRRYRQKKYCIGEHESVQEKNKRTQQANRKVSRYLRQSSNRFSRDLNEDFQSGSNSADNNQ